MTPRNPRPLTKNVHPMPTRPITSPATAGPTMRARLKPAELSATALDTSARPTSSITNDWRAGWSTTLAKPSARPNVATCQYST